MVGLSHSVKHSACILHINVLNSLTFFNIAKKQNKITKTSIVNNRDGISNKSDVFTIIIEKNILTMPYLRHDNY